MLNYNFVLFYWLWGIMWDRNSIWLYLNFHALQVTVYILPSAAYLMSTLFGTDIVCGIAYTIQLLLFSKVSFFIGIKRRQGNEGTEAQVLLE